MNKTPLDFAGAIRISLPALSTEPIQKSTWLSTEKIDSSISSVNKHKTVTGIAFDLVGRFFGI